MEEDANAVALALAAVAAFLVGDAGEEDEFSAALAASHVEAPNTALSSGRPTSAASTLAHSAATAAT